MLDEQSSVPAAPGEIGMGGECIAHAAQYPGTRWIPQYLDTAIPKLAGACRLRIDRFPDTNRAAAEGSGDQRPECPKNVSH